MKQQRKEKIKLLQKKDFFSINVQLVKQHTKKAQKEFITLSQVINNFLDFL